MRKLSSSGWQIGASAVIALVLVCLVIRNHMDERDIILSRVLTNAEITGCSFVTSSGFGIHYKFMVDGVVFTGTSLCPQCLGLCKEPSCCIGMSIPIQYASTNPTKSRMVEGSFPQ